MLSIEYVAGFMDGEGCFGFQKGRYAKYKPLISVGNTNVSIIRALLYTFQIWGIEARLSTEESRLRRQKDFYRILINKRDSVYMLCQILHPCLKIKQPNADAIMQFIEARRTEGLKKDTLKDIKMMLVERVRILNKKGKT